MILILLSLCFLPKASHLVYNEMISYNKVIVDYNLHCHVYSSRIKTFEKAVEKTHKMSIKNVYDLPDLISFRYVFYQKDELYKFYHFNKLTKNIISTQNTVNNLDGMKFFKFNYLHKYPELPFKVLECQLFVIEDYYKFINYS